jgi:hypothetical protein
MKKNIVIILVSLVLLGCATTQNFESNLNRYLGRSESDVVSLLGPPSSFYETADARFLTWSSSSNVFIPATPSTYQSTVIGNTVYTTPIGGSSAQNITYSCEFTITFQPREVIDLRAEGEPSTSQFVAVDWRYRGNDCRA